MLDKLSKSVPRFISRRNQLHAGNKSLVLVVQLLADRLHTILLLILNINASIFWAITELQAMESDGRHWASSSINPLPFSVHDLKNVDSSLLCFLLANYFNEVVDNFIFSAQSSLKHKSIAIYTLPSLLR